MYKSISFNPVERLAITYTYTYLHNALSQEECDRALALCKEYQTKRATVGAIKEGSVNEDVRRSNISFIAPDEKNTWLFHKLANMISNMNEEYYNFNLNGFERFQFTEYTSEDSGYYNWHVDCFLGKPDSTMQAMRKLSVSVLLNDDFEGGEFEVHEGDSNEPVKTGMKKGTAILFPSFVGHRVTPVTKGNRYSIVVWVYGPKFI
jgi:PKHD-type hydroxylase